jgi:hypothetical protein
MIFELKRIDVWSVVKITFIIFLIVGFLFSLISFALMNTFSGIFEQLGSEMAAPPSGTVAGFAGLFASVFFALFYAAIMSVMVAIALAVYNLIATSLGGFKFYFVEHSIETQPGSVPPQTYSEPDRSEEENQE